jgi:hypothetical protein
MIKTLRRSLAAGGFAACLAVGLGAGLDQARASSHMDAPLISLDDPANTTDVYAFISRRTQGRADYLTAALSVYPFEEPGIGPNNYRFDDTVVYDIHVALDGNIRKGRPDFTYRFEFDTQIPNKDTILQTYLGVLEPQGANKYPTNQNLRQSYKVTLLDWRSGRKEPVTIPLGENIVVPPNNQGRVTPYYNQNNDGDQPAKEGVSTAAALDPYTANAIAKARRDHRVFAGQRDDGFYADIQSIFDLDFTFGRDRNTPTKPFDSQKGFNVHTIAIEIPLVQLGRAKIAGVYATTSRRQGRDLVQVGRQGNPLFAEALLKNADKDKYNRSNPADDDRFGYAVDSPVLSSVLNVQPIIPGLLRSIFIPDMIRVDLTTGPAKLSGQNGFNRLSVFGGDTLKSTAQDPFNNGGFIPGGWPNGRRFGDDVVDIALIALGAAGAGPYTNVDLDRVTQNDITYNQVFPYAATPLNGRVHSHE